MDEFSPVPEACTLPTTEVPLRLAEVDVLLSQHVHSLERVSPTETRMHLVGPRGLLDAVRDLTAREASCCTFFEFEVTPIEAEDGREHVQLVVRVPESHVDVLTALSQRPVLGDVSTRESDGHTDLTT